ncbi:carboxymuconolactone decarboxylase family protein [Demequina sp. SYSU T00039]|uniref:Carboxymuconolactone decarboxylase family protein n=1 Tax=Demequina lignilytica TaxID=3051663 RepID=A0AAW7M7F1_9MICO|nr:MULTISPECIES: carboxymuconolactone decarboxylase family protein [unclassified Demequina]MDN4477360.1 carboxymuconolactone decarboxylase family protein [Demequina sp. SYSU T00039-1]MDN4487533.1 carboxymuconolactone decarboxylase family protein [Demequina sp. SYSU T00039]MDN4490997.1 carboxymuconolactone decarboxylase family protein [Demequina sp. SYSU T00068]
MRATLAGDVLKELEALDARAGAQLEPRLRDMLRLRVSYLNGCVNSIRLHSESLTLEGVRPDVIAALARPVRLMRAGLVSDGEEAALRLAEVLTDAPRGLEPEARVDAGHWYNSTQIGAIVQTVALTNAWNRVLRGTD